MTPEISVMILCYCAGQRIRVFVEEVICHLNEAHLDWEIILVANYIEGNNDETPQVIQQIARRDSRIKTVTQPKEGWYGWDAQTGFALCRGKTICYIDGDSQMPAEDIPKAYRFLKDEGYDVVMPYRKQRQDPWIRRVNSKVYNFIYNCLFPGYPIRDVHSKPKIFTREIFDTLKPSAKDWFIDAELLIQCRRYRYRIKQFPTLFRPSPYLKSFVRFDTIFEFLVNLIRARYREFFMPQPTSSKSLTKEYTPRVVKR